MQNRDAGQIACWGMWLTTLGIFTKRYFSCERRVEPENFAELEGLTGPRAGSGNVRREPCPKQLGNVFTFFLLCHQLVNKESDYLLMRSHPIIRSKTSYPLHFFFYFFWLRNANPGLHEHVTAVRGMGRGVEGEEGKRGPPV